MATLIPAMGSCVGRMTPGQRRLAERLQQKLDDDYLLWYDVPVGPKQSHPDFVVMHPRRGILILETKDWKLETILRATRQAWDILANGLPKVVINPLAKARHCAIPGVGQMPGDGADEQEEARLFYVAATRATQRLVIAVSGKGGWGAVGGCG